MLNTSSNQNKEGSSMKQIERILVYINSHAAHFIDKSVIKNFLNKKLETKKWVACTEVMIPEELRGNMSMMTENFFHGVSAYQYSMIYDGGTFINPMLYGLTTDFLMWNDVLHSEPDFYQDVVYIDVPYEVYEQAAWDSPSFVDKEDYEQSSQQIKDMVERIKQTYYPTGTVLH